jgi:rubrerythrin
MNRLLLTLAVILLVFLLLRAARRRTSRGDRHSGTTSRRTERGAPRLLVCGACGTQFAPDAQSWICPKCGK